jgi:hypothetical protein
MLLRKAVHLLGEQFLLVVEFKVHGGPWYSNSVTRSTP